MRRALTVLILLASQTTAAEYTARCVGVSDGDTITVLRDGRTSTKIRLHGVDAPETGQDFGARSKQAASELVFGRPVKVLERDTDRYGRTVAVVLLEDGRSLNEVQIRSGMAWWYRSYAPKDRQLAVAEAEARAAKRGLWAQPDAVPPWEWRKGGGMPQGPPGSVVGNRNSHVYHRPSCPSVRKMAERNRVDFRSAAEAENAGYRKAGDCR